MSLHPFQMKIDQIAYYAHTKRQVEDIMRHWGLLEADWIYDNVVGEVYLPRQGITSTLKGVLRFCYKYEIGLEILTYTDGPHWHIHDERFLSGQPFLSHVGMHMENYQVSCQRPPGELVQTMYSVSHTNPELVKSGRKYYYEIIDTRALLGHYTKCIWRRNSDVVVTP